MQPSFDSYRKVVRGHSPVTRSTGALNENQLESKKHFTNLYILENTKNVTAFKFMKTRNNFQNITLINIPKLTLM